MFKLNRLNKITIFILGISITTTAFASYNSLPDDEIQALRIKNLGAELGHLRLVRGVTNEGKDKERYSERYWVGFDKHGNSSGRPHLKGDFADLAFLKKSSTRLKEVFDVITTDGFVYAENWNSEYIECYARMLKKDGKLILDGRTVSTLSVNFISDDSINYPPQDDIDFNALEREFTVYCANNNYNPGYTFLNYIFDKEEIEPSRDISIAKKFTEYIDIFVQERNTAAFHKSMRDFFKSVTILENAQLDIPDRAECSSLAGPKLGKVLIYENPYGIDD